jgi:hypothetical protein
MDINVQHGTALFSPVDGRVEVCGATGFYQPVHVDILDDQGRYHILGHMSVTSQDIGVGSRVTRGQYLGNSGTPPGAGAHLHYELRDGGFSGRAITPEPVLTEGGNGGGPGRDFGVRDLIKVIDGPVRLRSDPTTNAEIVRELSTGDELCVLGGPEEAAGFVWYRVDSGKRKGWVAGRFCALAQKNGCPGEHD